MKVKRGTQSAQVCQKDVINNLFFFSTSGSFFFLIYKFIYLFLFLAELGLCCCARASQRGGFSCCGAWALGVRASVVVAHRLQ